MRVISTFLGEGLRGLIPSHMKSGTKSLIEMSLRVGEYRDIKPQSINNMYSKHHFDSSPIVPELLVHGRKKLGSSSGCGVPYEVDPST